MNEQKHAEEWREGDETWQLLGKAVPKHASARFADDVVRAVRILPEREPFWPRVLIFSRWSLVAACVILVASILSDPTQNHPIKVSSVPENSGIDPSAQPARLSGDVGSRDAQWEHIEDVAQAEILAAAAEHLDDFSDQDLVTMIGF
jgi:hypothetical protein